MSTRQISKNTLKIFIMCLCILQPVFSGNLNIVLFISDDHGYRDSGPYGDSYIKTPNMDKLAMESKRFTHAFAASPLCSPSRSVIQTGLMPFRSGAHKFGTKVTPGLQTMPEYFKDMGYYTAHYGKFHTMPKKQFPYDVIDRDENKAFSFLAKYNKKKPFLLVVCTYPPHTPWVENKDYDPNKIELPPNFVNTPQTLLDRADYYQDVTLMDSILGGVLDAVKDNGFEDSTLFLYTSDQGANWPFGKWNLYDEGIRVPLLVRWPGETAAGRVSQAMVSLADLLPTMIEAAGGVIPDDIDGQSFLNVIKGFTEEHRDVIFSHHTGNDNGGPGIWNHCPARSIRTRTHKYIINLSPDTLFTTHITGSPPTSTHYLAFWDTWVKKADTDEKAEKLVNAYQHRPAEELYNLENDPYEMNNLAADTNSCELLRNLRKQLKEWNEEQGDTLVTDLFWRSLPEYPTVVRKIRKAERSAAIVRSLGKGMVRITGLKASLSPTHLRIYDIRGKLVNAVSTRSVSSDGVMLSLAPGFYTLQLVRRDNAPKETVNFIVE